MKSKIFLCGKGNAANNLAQIIGMLSGVSRVAFFTHDHSSMTDEIREMGVVVSTKNVNEISRWPFVPDIIMSVGYLNIINRDVLRLCPNSVNCHYSLLPLHRGRSPVPWSILSGDKVTGITWHRIDPGIDTGDVIMQMTTQIDDFETAKSLFDKLDLLVSYTWVNVLSLATCPSSLVSSLPQSLLGYSSSYHKAGPPFDGVIDHDWDYDTKERFIRAMTYPPLPYARTPEGVEIKTIDQYTEMFERG